MKGKTMARGTTLRRVMQLMQRVGAIIYHYNDEDTPDQSECRCCGERSAIYTKMDHNQDCIFYEE